MIANRRDLGGLPAAGGKTVRPGMLVRSAHLAQAEASELEGISSVIDLRTPRERDDSPDICYGAEYLPLPVFNEAKVGISRESGIAVPELPDMEVLYRVLPGDCAEAFGRIVRAIITHDFSKGAVLWHCTEGKDRCGMTTALVLTLLGVPREEIIKDYLKTNIVNVPKAEKIKQRLILERGEEFAESVYHMYIAEERYITAALDKFTPEYIKGLALDDEAVSAFRETVLC